MTRTPHGTLQFKRDAAPHILALSLETRVPPVALTVIAASLMWISSLTAPAFDTGLPHNVACAAGSVVAGALVCLAGVGSFQRAKTTVNPMKLDSSSALVASGIYNYSRNPMYLGFALILFGWGLLLSNALALLLVPVFVLYMSRFQICPEERALLRQFGKHYEEYQARVRRWL